LTCDRFGDSGAEVESNAGKRHSIKRADWFSPIRFNRRPDSLLRSC